VHYSLKEGNPHATNFQKKNWRGNNRKISGSGRTSPESRALFPRLLLNRSPAACFYRYAAGIDLSIRFRKLRRTCSRRCTPCQASRGQPQRRNPVSCNGRDVPPSCQSIPEKKRVEIPEGCAEIKRIQTVRCLLGASRTDCPHGSRLV